MQDIRERVAPVVRGISVTTVATLLITFAIIDGPVRTALGALAVKPGPAEPVTRVVFFLAALVLVYASIRSDSRTARTRNTAISDVPHSAGAEPVENFRSFQARALAAAGAINEKYFSESIALYASMLLEMSYRSRVKERVVLHRGYATKIIQLDYAIKADEKEAILLRAAQALPPEGATEAFTKVQELASEAIKTPGPRSAVMLVPLVPLPKGVILSDLEIHDSRGNRLPELTQDQRLGLSCMALSAPFELAFRNVRVEDNPGKGQFGTEVIYDKNADARLWRLRQMVLSPSSIPQEVVKREFSEAVGSLEVTHWGARERLESLCLFLAQYYYVVCEVPVPEGFLSTIEMRNDVTILNGTNSKVQQVYDFFGMEPQRYDLDLSLCYFTNNYQAEIDGGSRLQYVQRQRVIDAGDNEEDAIDKEEVDDKYLRPLGQGQVTSYSDPDRVAPHVKIRNFNSHIPRKLKWEVYVEEIPPGTLAPVVVFSAISTVLSICFSFIVPHAATEHFDAPALVVAMPLFVVTFFGFSFEKMARSSIVGVLMFAACSALIVISAVLVLVSTAYPPGVVHNPTLVGGWRIPDFSWSLLSCSLIQLILTLNLSFLIYRRVQRHRAVTYNAIAEAN